MSILGGFLHFICVVETRSVSTRAVAARLDGSTKVGFTTQFAVLEMMEKHIFKNYDVK